MQKHRYFSQEFSAAIVASNILRRVSVTAGANVKASLRSIVEVDESISKRDQETRCADREMQFSLRSRSSISMRASAEKTRATHSLAGFPLDVLLSTRNIIQSSRGKNVDDF
jgi:hypothetical protein